MKRRNQQYDFKTMLRDIYLKLCEVFKFMFYTLSLMLATLTLFLILIRVLENDISLNICYLCVILFVSIYCNSKLG